MTSSVLRSYHMERCHLERADSAQHTRAQQKPFGIVAWDQTVLVWVEADWRKNTVRWFQFDGLKGQLSQIMENVIFPCTSSGILQT